MNNLRTLKVPKNDSSQRNIPPHLPGILEEKNKAGLFYTYYEWS